MCVNKLHSVSIYGTSMMFDFTSLGQEKRIESDQTHPLGITKPSCLPEALMQEVVAAPPR